MNNLQLLVRLAKLYNIEKYKYKEKIFNQFINQLNHLKNYRVQNWLNKLIDNR